MIDGKRTMFMPSKGVSNKEFTDFVSEMKEISLEKILEKSIMLSGTIKPVPKNSAFLDARKRRKLKEDITSYREPKVDQASPWGLIQTVKNLAQGIWKVTTVSHGGIKLSPDRNKQIPKDVRSSDEWYEEDEAMEIVYLTFSNEISESKKRKRRKLKEDVEFSLNGDGMTNIHPEIETTSFGSGDYWFTMNQSDFDNYLKSKGVHEDDGKIVDDDDGFVFGRIPYQESRKRRKLKDGKKRFRINPQIGTTKYSVDYHDGVSTHNDGSDFFDLRIYKTKKALAKGIEDFKQKGYVEESRKRKGGVSSNKNRKLKRKIKEQTNQFDWSDRVRENPESLFGGITLLAVDGEDISTKEDVIVGIMHDGSGHTPGGVAVITYGDNNLDYVFQCVNELLQEKMEERMDESDWETAKEDAAELGMELYEFLQEGWDGFHVSLTVPEFLACVKASTEADQIMIQNAVSLSDPKNNKIDLLGDYTVNDSKPVESRKRKFRRKVQEQEDKGQWTFYDSDWPMWIRGEDHVRITPVNPSNKDADNYELWYSCSSDNRYNREFKQLYLGTFDECKVEADKYINANGGLGESKKRKSRRKIQEQEDDIQDEIVDDEISDEEITDDMIFEYGLVTGFLLAHGYTMDEIAEMEDTFEVFDKLWEEAFGESSDEDDDFENNYQPDGTGPQGRGNGPGKGRKDGSGMNLDEEDLEERKRHKKSRKIVDSQQARKYKVVAVLPDGQRFEDEAHVGDRDEAFGVSKEDAENRAYNLDLDRPEGHEDVSYEVEELDDRDIRNMKEEDIEEKKIRNKIKLLTSKNIDELVREDIIHLAETHSQNGKMKEFLLASVSDSMLTNLIKLRFRKEQK